MAKALTEIFVKNLKPAASRQEVPDGRVVGLYLVVQPSGARSWAVRYRAAGKSRKLTLGAFPSIDIATARKMALKALGDAASGNDPAAARRAAKAAEAAAKAKGDTIVEIVEQFERKYLPKRVKSSWAREAGRLLRVEVVPKLGDRRLAEVTRREVRRLFEDIAERGGVGVTANRAFAVFRRLCNWAVQQELIAVSPCAGLERPVVEKSRDRVLDDDEIRDAWRAFETIGYPYGTIGKLLLLTGARRSEVAEAKWSEFDLRARTWSIPATRTKNGRAHEIPLSDPVVEILSDIPRIGPTDGLLFTVDGRQRVTGFSQAKNVLRRVIRAARPDGVEPSAWNLHDLRRSLATNFQKLGVRLEVTEATLNHVSGSRSGIVGIYQRHEWQREKRAALEAWARRLHEIVSGEAAAKVVELASARP